MTTDPSRSRSESAIQAARENDMSANEWAGAGEIRIYLRRNNAARTEAGYIRLYEADGKAKSALVITASGTGSRTAQAEAEKTYAAYKAMRAAIVAARMEAK